MWPIMVVTCFKLKWQQATKQYTKEFRDILNLMQLIRHHLQRIHWFVLCLFFLNRCIVAHYLNISLVHCEAGWFFTCSTIPKKIYRQLAKQHSSQNERIDIIQSNAFYFEFVSFFLIEWIQTTTSIRYTLRCRFRFHCHSKQSWFIQMNGIMRLCMSRWYLYIGKLGVVRSIFLLLLNSENENPCSIVAFSHSQPIPFIKEPTYFQVFLFFGLCHILYFSIPCEW